MRSSNDLEYFLKLHGRGTKTKVWLEPPTFRLTAERANRLRQRDDTYELS